MTILVSLIGIPPMVGFIGKFAIFRALVDAGGPWMIGLLVIAGINTVISLIYYLRVAKVVCMDPEPETRGPVSLGVLPATYVLVVALPGADLRHHPGPADRDRPSGRPRRHIVDVEVGLDENSSTLVSH